MIYKVLVGDEHGGAAVASSQILDAFLDKDENFKVLFLTKGRFSEKYESDNITNLSSGCPPIIQSSSKIKVVFNYIKFLIWIIKTLLKFNRFVRKNNVHFIHTTNNHALLICLLSKYFFPDLYIISHWRCVGLASTSLYKNLLPKVNKIIAISNAVKQSLPDQLRDNTMVIYDGVDVTQKYTENIRNKGKLRKLLNIPDNVFLVGTIGSYTTIKCHDLMIEGLALSENKNYAIVLMGSTPNYESEKYLRYLKDKVAANGLENKVFFVDNTMIEKPNEYIVDLNLFVAATWNNGRGEGFGLVYVEAMAAQLPVVAINVGAAGEIISSESGFLMKENSPRELNEIISQAIDNPELKNMQNAIQKRSEMFDISITNNNIKQVYDTLR